MENKVGYFLKVGELIGQVTKNPQGRGWLTTYASIDSEVYGGVYGDFYNGDFDQLDPSAYRWEVDIKQTKKGFVVLVKGLFWVNRGGDKK